MRNTITTMGVGAAIVLIGVLGILPRVMQAASAKVTLGDSLRCMQQNPPCSPIPSPTQEAVPNNSIGN